MYCQSCGRNSETSYSCLHKHPLKKKEVIIIFFLFSFFPMAALMFYSDYELMKVGSITLTILLLFVTAMEILLKRNYLALFFGCHQKIDRSINPFGLLLPLCSRCTGIYIGILLTSLYHLIYHQMPWYVYIVFGVPLLFDGLLQKYANIRSNHLRRLVSGMLFGFTLVFLFTYYHKLIITLLQMLFNR